jgi:hypothetical protein
LGAIRTQIEQCRGTESWRKKTICKIRTAAHNRFAFAACLAALEWIGLANGWQINVTAVTV